MGKINIWKIPMFTSNNITIISTTNVMVKSILRNNRSVSCIILDISNILYKVLLIVSLIVFLIVSLIVSIDIERV